MVMIGIGVIAILVVDDGEAIAGSNVPNLLALGLAPGSQVVCRQGLSEGLAALAGESFDAVLLGLSADKGDLAGLSSLRRQREGCPIIVAGPDDPKLMAHALELGAVDYLPLPGLDGPLLMRAIRYAVSQSADVRSLRAALEEEHNLLRSVIDSIPDHIYVKDLEHRFILVNRATQTFFNCPADSLIGKTDHDFFTPEAADAFRWEENQVLCSGQPFTNREAQITGADGQQKWTLTTKAPIRDQRSNVIGLVGINRDISARKSAMLQLEHANATLARREQELLTALDDVKRSHDALTTTQLQLLQVEKLETVGRLAAGIAHEVKNPLQIISAGLDYLGQGIGAGQTPASRAIESMRRAVKRADSVIRGLLDFSTPAALQAEPCDLNSVVRQALILVDHELMRCKVALRVELADALPAVCIDANKVEQVFLNLFINALQAMPDGGVLTLRTRVEQLAALGHNMGDNRAERFRAGEVVVVAEVDDTGHGIPEDKLVKVFDPFFTTKPTGKGTGLGLSVAKTIVELHGGLLQLVNRPEGGVRALLVLKATGDQSHDGNECSQDPCVDRGRRAGLHAHDGNGTAADGRL